MLGYLEAWLHYSHVLYQNYWWMINRAGGKLNHIYGICSYTTPITGSRSDINVGITQEKPIMHSLWYTLYSQTNQYFKWFLLVQMYLLIPVIQIIDNKNGNWQTIFRQVKQHQQNITTDLFSSLCLWDNTCSLMNKVMHKEPDIE